MNPEQFTAQMVHNAQRIQTLTLGVTNEQGRWKPDPDSWSMTEVINHLYDEERHDFRVRLEYILYRPGQPWPPNNPQEWVTERQYNERELQPSVNNFLRERQQSLDWLKTLDAPDWEQAEPTPWGGTLRAGDMFAAWVAHDLLHLRQLVELHYAYLVEQVKPYHTGYAGDW